MNRSAFAGYEIHFRKLDLLKRKQPFTFEPEFIQTL